MTEDPTPHDPTPLHGPEPDDATVRRLRDALTREADQIQPTDRFAAILDRAAAPAPARARRRVGRLLVAAACVVLALAGGLTVIRLGLGPQAPMSAERAEPSQVAQEPPPSQLPPAAASSGPPRPAAGVVPVFAIGPDGTLFRELRDVGTAADPLDRAAAAIAALATTPTDPDYRTAWAGLGSAQVARDGATLVVTLALPAALPDGISPAAAVQQLVWTTVAAVAPDTAAPPPVRIDAAGPVPAWAEAVVGEPQTLDPAARADIWIDSPTEGAQVAGELVVTGDATSFEGALSWHVVAADETVVATGRTHGGANGAYGPFRFRLDLPPGTYTVAVTSADPASGAARTGDTKQFTVR